MEKREKMSIRSMVRRGALSLLLGCCALNGLAAQVTLQWTAPTENVDGSSLSDLAGYRIYQGAAPDAYTDVTDVGDVTQVTVDGVTEGVSTYFAVSAYNIAGIESALSADVAVVPIGGVTGSQSGSDYLAGGIASVAGEFSYPAGESVLSLRWRPHLPTGWVLGAVSGDGAPEVQDGEIVFSGQLGSSPIRFQYELHVPDGESGTQMVSADVYYLLLGMINPLMVAAQPESLALVPLEAPPPVPLVSLSVASAYGDPTPAIGVHSYPEGSVVTCSVTGGPLPLGAGAQVLCTGWQGTGSVPGSGTETSVDVSLQADSSISWQWKSQYLYSVTADIGGSVSGSGDGWYDRDVGVSAIATPSAGFEFAGWVGDVPGGRETENPLDLTVTGPISISARFTEAPLVVSAEHASAGHFADSVSIVVTCSFAFPGERTLTSLSWTPELPSGLSLLSASGGASPVVEGSQIVFGGPFTGSPVTFAYTVAIAGRPAKKYTVGGSATFLLAGMSSPSDVRALPDPLTIVRQRGKVVKTSTADMTVASADQTLLTSEPVESFSAASLSTTLEPTGGVQATQDAPQGYDPGGELTVTNSLHFDRDLLALRWRPVLPAGWQLLSARGDGAPQAINGELIWSGTLPSSPVHVEYTVGIPAWAWSDVQISAEVDLFEQYGLEPTIAIPDSGMDVVRPVDEDGDGLADAWERLHAIDSENLSPDVDHDGDGMDNRSEYLAGTVPSDKRSVLDLTGVAASSQEGRTITWQSAEGRSYTILRSSSGLGDFVPIATGILATAPRNSYLDPETLSPSGRCFYKVELVP